MYDIIMTERFDFHKARLGKGGGVSVAKANFYGVNQIVCYV